MSQKQAKRLRKTAQLMGIYDPSKETQYKAIEHKKMVSFIDSKGVPQMVPVIRKQFINASKHGLRRLKQAYRDGQITLHSLKDLHVMAKQQKESKGA